MLVWGFPKIKGTFLGVPIIRTIVLWGLYWGPPILGNYHIIPNAASQTRAMMHARAQDEKAETIGPCELYSTLLKEGAI